MYVIKYSVFVLIGMLIAVAPGPISVMLAIPTVVGIFGLAMLDKQRDETHRRERTIL